MTVKESLISKEIVSYELARDGGTITFWFAPLDYRSKNPRPMTRLRTYGDCCSATWIEGIDDPGALHGYVLDVEEILMPDQVQRVTPLCPYPDSVAFYGLKITTPHGRAVIEYRNNSNGYYGGSLEVDEVVNPTQEAPK